MKHRKMIKPNTIVRFVLSEQDDPIFYPFKDGEHLIFLGEITNMPGHCTIASKSGKVYFGYHLYNFEEIEC